MSTGATHTTYGTKPCYTPSPSSQHVGEYWTSVIPTAITSFDQLSQQAAREETERIARGPPPLDRSHIGSSAWNWEPSDPGAYGSMAGNDEGWESDEDCDEDPSVEAASLPEINFSGPPPSGPSIANVFNTTPAGYKVTPKGPTTLVFHPIY